MPEPLRRIMAEVPLSMEQIEVIVAQCAQDLLEKWAIESDISEAETEHYAALAADTVIFVISRYMDYVNTLMDLAAHEFGIATD